jgi:S-adenosylmethionine synthetase
MSKKIVTSESVGFGHPDKVADQISDALVDAFVEQDMNAHCGIETLIKDNVVVLGGEVSSTSHVDYEDVVRSVFDSLPIPQNHNLRSHQIKIINLIGLQSPEIRQGVVKEDGEIGAGDQGLMFGFASNETPTYMPLGCYITKNICQYITSRHDLELGPDVKSQVSIVYNEDGSVEIPYILVSTMHQDSLFNTRNIVKNFILNNDIGLDWDIFLKYIKNNENLKIDINPCGSWNIGLSISDAGVTGRKIIVDTYGGYCQHGGGSFSGKNMTKVDRSAAYMARYLAKNIVASGISNTAKVELSYQIGVAQPSSINLELDINQYRQEDILNYIKNKISLSPKGIIERFGIEKRNFNSARYGHFGYNVEYNDTLRFFYPWEKLDFAMDLKKYLENVI